MFSFAGQAACEMWFPGVGAFRSGEVEGSVSPTWAPSSPFSSYSCLSSKGCHQPTALWASCQAVAAGEGDIIHPGDKAADERWASRQLFLLSVVGTDVRDTQGCGGRGTILR